MIDRNADTDPAGEQGPASDHNTCSECGMPHDDWESDLCESCYSDWWWETTYRNMTDKQREAYIRWAAN